MKKAAIIFVLFAFVIVLLQADCLWASFDKGVFDAQTRLKSLGYDPGPIDAVWGNKTRKAVIEFQKDNQLPQTGELDRETIEKLFYFEKITASIPDSIKCTHWKNPLGEDIWRYDFDVTFSESQGVSATIYKLYRVYVDRFGVKWSSSFGRGESVDIKIPANGSYIYKSWVQCSEDSDLRGGKVIVKYSATDPYGETSSGSVSSNLAWPE